MTNETNQLCDTQAEIEQLLPEALGKMEQVATISSSVAKLPPYIMYKPVQINIEYPKEGGDVLIMFVRSESPSESQHSDPQEMSGIQALMIRLDYIPEERRAYLQKKLSQMNLKTE